MPTLFPILTLTDAERALLTSTLQNLTEEQRNALCDASVPRIIHNDIGVALGLSAEQEGAVARSVAIYVLGLTNSDALADIVRDTVSVPAETAATIASALAPVLLGVDVVSAGGARASFEPIVATDAQGREGLRYPNLESLLNDLEPLSADEKTKFLNDVRPFNRVLVMEALSQLKMGADAQGNPLSFRTLLAAEAPTLTPQDWADALGTDPDALLEAGVLPSLFAVLTPMLFADLMRNAPSVRAVQVLMEAARQRDTLADSVRYTPLCAMLAQKSPTEAASVIETFLSLSEDTRALATSAETVATISSLIATNTLPATHAIAAARTAYFLATGQVQPAQVASLMERVGLPPQASNRVQAAFASLFVPPEPATIPPSKPAPRRIAPTAPKSMAPRGIIDLRKDRTV